MTDLQKVKYRLIEKLVHEAWLLGDAPVLVPRSRHLHPSSHMHGKRSSAMEHNRLLALIEEVFDDA